MKNLKIKYILKKLYGINTFKSIQILKKLRISPNISENSLTMYQRYVINKFIKENTHTQKTHRALLKHYNKSTQRLKNINTSKSTSKSTLKK
jgi:ribosomal protein S13